MKELLKNTYLLNLRKIREDIESLWKRYQKILNKKKPSWEELNEARAVLYFIGYLYPEKIALESLEARVRHLKPRISLEEFLLAVDTADNNTFKKFEKSKEFIRLKEFYSIVKDIKNRVKNNSYLDEERFNKIYSSVKPKNYF